MAQSWSACLACDSLRLHPYYQNRILFPPQEGLSFLIKEGFLLYQMTCKDLTGMGWASMQSGQLWKVPAQGGSLIGRKAAESPALVSKNNSSGMPS